MGICPHQYVEMTKLSPPTLSVNPLIVRSFTETLDKSDALVSEREQSGSQHFLFHVDWLNIQRYLYFCIAVALLFTHQLCGVCNA